MGRYADLEQANIAMLVSGITGLSIELKSLWNNNRMNEYIDIYLEERIHITTVSPGCTLNLDCRMPANLATLSNSSLRTKW